jgi:hypothetical protein
MKLQPWTFSEARRRFIDDDLVQSVMNEKKMENNDD